MAGPPGQIARILPLSAAAASPRHVFATSAAAPVNLPLRETQTHQMTHHASGCNAGK